MTAIPDIIQNRVGASKELSNKNLAHTHPGGSLADMLRLAHRALRLP